MATHHTLSLDSAAELRIAKMRAHLDRTAALKSTQPARSLSFLRGRQVTSPPLAASARASGHLDLDDAVSMRMRRARSESVGSEAELSDGGEAMYEASVLAASKPKPDSPLSPGLMAKLGSVSMLASLALPKPAPASKKRDRIGLEAEAEAERNGVPKVGRASLQSSPGQEAKRKERERLRQERRASATPYQGSVLFGAAGDPDDSDSDGGAHFQFGTMSKPETRLPRAPRLEASLLRERKEKAVAMKALEALASQPAIGGSMMMEDEVDMGMAGAGTAVARVRSTAPEKLDMSLVSTVDLSNPDAAIHILDEIPASMRHPITAQFGLRASNQEATLAALSRAFRQFYAEEDAAIYAASSGRKDAHGVVVLPKATDVRFSASYSVGSTSFKIERRRAPDAFAAADEFSFIRVSGGSFREPLDLIGTPVSHSTTEGAWDSVIRGNMTDVTSGSGGFSPHGGSMSCSYFNVGDGNFGNPYTGRADASRCVYLKGHTYMPLGASYAVIDPVFIRDKMIEIRAKVPDARGNLKLCHRIFWRWLDHNMNTFDTAALVNMFNRTEVSREAGTFFVLPGGKSSSLAQLGGVNLMNGDSVSRTGWLAASSARRKKKSSRDTAITNHHMVRKLSGAAKVNYLRNVSDSLKYIITSTDGMDSPTRGSFARQFDSLKRDLLSDERRVSSAASVHTASAAYPRHRFAMGGGASPRGGYSLRGRGRGRGGDSRNTTSFRGSSLRDSVRGGGRGGGRGGKTSSASHLNRK